MSNIKCVISLFIVIQSRVTHIRFIYFKAVNKSNNRNTIKVSKVKTIMRTKLVGHLTILVLISVLCKLKKQQKL